MTAHELAGHLEVSVRTIYRDVESLSSAGVPVYADRGPAGGYQLLDGYRTRLTGLTGDEAETLFLAGMPAAAAELGLGTVLAAAELKLLAALPPELGARAGRIRERFHLDAPGWFRESESTPHLAAVAEAVWNDRVIQMRYRRWKAPREVTRTLAPLGVVLKAGRWYVVGRAGDQIRTYRVANILEMSQLAEKFDRTADFDLAEFWQSWTRRYEESVYRDEAAIRVSAEGMRVMPFLLPPAMARAARAAAGAPDWNGWVETTLPIESLRHGYRELMRFGDEVEVLAPAELRETFRYAATALAEMYTNERRDAA